MSTNVTNKKKSKNSKPKYFYTDVNSIQMVGLCDMSYVLDRPFNAIWILDKWMPSCFLMYWSGIWMVHWTYHIYLPFEYWTISISRYSNMSGNQMVGLQLLIVEVSSNKKFYLKKQSNLRLKLKTYGYFYTKKKYRNFTNPKNSLKTFQTNNRTKTINLAWKKCAYI